jgi:hypothetical protein
LQPLLSTREVAIPIFKSTAVISQFDVFESYAP